LIAADTNLLVYAHRADAEWHDAASVCIKRLAEGSITWGIPWPCVHEFLSIVTHPRIYAPPSSLEQAIDQIDAWLESPRAELIGESYTHWDVLKSQLTKGKVRGPMVQDARIAAICIGKGVTEFWSADREFSRFPALRTLNPLATPFDE
jgi:toxin-antitoxin system PIN domain toxin